MTTSTKSTKSTKSVTDPREVRAYASLASKTHAQEVDYIHERARRVSNGSLSVRVLSASIREASKLGKAPTVRGSHAQDIVRTSLILNGAVGVDKVALSKVLTMSTRMRLGFGGADLADAKVAEFVTAALPFDEWDSVVPASNDRGNGDDTTGEESGDGSVSVHALAGATADDILRATVEALRALEDITVTDRDTVRTLLGILKGSGMVK